MKIGLVEMVPNITAVNVPGYRGGMTFVEDRSTLPGQPCAVLRWDHNGGLYLIPVKDIEVSLRANRTPKKPTKGKTRK